MKKQLLLYLSLFLFTQLGHAQISSLKWAKQQGGNVRSMATDLTGNVITGGVFSGTADFDPAGSNFNLVSDGSYEGFVSKVDANGNFQWAFKIGSTSADYVHDVAVDDFGNVYVSGGFQNTVDFDPSANIVNLIAVDSQDGYVAKYDPSGALIWAKQIGGTSQQDAYSVTVDNAGNVYTTGSFYGTVDFDPGPGAENLSAQNVFDAFILKLDSNGDFVWVRQLKGNSEISAVDIQLDNNDNAFVVGYFHETIDFDPNASNFSMTSNAGFVDGFFMKLDNTGDFVWAKQIGGSGNANSLSISISALGDLYLAGEFRNTADFDPNAGITNLSSLGDNDAYLAKYDNNGNFLWVNQLGGTDRSAARDIALSVNDQVYVTGYFKGAVDFNMGGTPNTVNSNGQNDVFIAQYDDNGVFIDVNGFGSSMGSDVGFAVEVDINGFVYVGGDFQETVDFDPGVGVDNLTAIGTDGFVIKLGDCNNTGTDTQTACETFTWIDGVTYTSSNNTAKDTLQNAEGCDSIITLDLTILDPVNHSETMTACESATINGNTYTTSQTVVDTYTGGAANGCDSIVTTILTINQPVNHAETMTTCESATINGNTYTTSQTVVDTYDGQAQNGCDSIVTTVLTINDLPDVTTTLNGNTITANLSGASYQWIDCDNGNTPITGETNASFTATTGGNYAVIVDDGDCVDTSDCVEVDVVGLSDEDNSIVDVNIYPNPTKDVLNISFSNATKEKITVELLDALGKVILSKTVKSNSGVLNMANFQRGIYFVRITNNARQMTYRVVKQ